MYESLLIGAQILLSAYPLLIKLVDTSLTFQTGLRMIVYTVLAAIAIQVTGSPLSLANLFSKETIYTGLLNLLHVGSSYVGYDQLTGGNATALFYTYPIWNIIGAATVFNEKIPTTSLPWIGLALLGAILLAQPSPQNWTVVGVCAALTAAITETIIYLWFKGKPTKSDEPWTKMLQMYGSSALLWIIGIGMFYALGKLGKNVFKISGEGLASIVAFNTFVGFVGYALRFYLIPKVSTVIFSSLSFIGIFFAYMLGWLVTNESPTLIQAFGAIAIIVANTVLLRREIV